MRQEAKTAMEGDQATVRVGDKVISGTVHSVNPVGYLDIQSEVSHVAVVSPSGTIAVVQQGSPDILEVKPQNKESK
jgi:hypothetical protein